MVFSEATLAVPLIVGYAYHKGAWKKPQGQGAGRACSKRATQAV